MDPGPVPASGREDGCSSEHYVNELLLWRCSEMNGSSELKSIP